MLFNIYKHILPLDLLNFSFYLILHGKGMYPHNFDEEKL